MNTDKNAIWTVSPGVRSTYTEDGAVLLETTERLVYRLNGVAAHVYVTIEGSPSGIGFEAIVDVLEMRFTVIREELERVVRDCLAKLQLAGLVGELGGREGSRTR